jgi:hypothetical protein
MRLLQGAGSVSSHTFTSYLLNGFLAACVLFIASGTLAYCQDATIVGTVVDPSGALVPGVKVIITNTDKNQSTDITTNDTGQFVAASLAIGHYNVKAEVSGFKTFEQNDIVLQVGDRTRVDVKLQVGNTRETITVEAEAIAVQSESGEVSDVITNKQMTQLATNGRSIYALTTLVPGASGNMSDLNSPTPLAGDASVSFNGMRESHNLYLIDGGEAADRGGAGGIDVMPSMDAVAEFRTNTSNYGAEYGLSSSATMTLQIKSGQKDFHASAWEFVRNDDLQAGNYFTNAAGAKTPELRQNTYGFNVSGPVTFGKLYNKERDKTFFFYNWEKRSLIQGGLVNQTVPSTSEYGGQFTTAINVPTGISPTIANLSGLGSTFAGNRIPTSLLNANSLALLSAGIFPAANDGNAFLGGNKLPTYLTENIIRIDHRFNDKFSIFGHFLHESSTQTYGTSLWSSDNVPTVGTNLANPAYHAVIHATYSITPTVLNEVAYNQNGNTINIVPNGVYARPSSVNIPELFPGNNLDRIPGIQLGGNTGTFYDVSSWPWHNKADDYQLRDDLSIVKGAHQIKLGASYAFYSKEQDLFGDTQGSFKFDGSYTGNDFADFLLGYAKSYTELAVQDHGTWDNKSPALYIQDNWHVNSRLTLNLGLRWDGIPHTYEQNNRQSNFYTALYNPAEAPIFLPGSGNNAISPSSPGLGGSPNAILSAAGTQFYLNGIGVAGSPGIPRGLVRDAWLNFGPRFGFAYDFLGDHKTVLRGGFGAMYERVQGNDVYNLGPNEPFSSSVTFSNVSINNPAQSLVTGQTLAAPITVGSITGLSYSDYHPPVSYQYSIGVERQLANNSVLNVSYVGNQNRHQNDYRNIDVPNQSYLAGLITNNAAYNTLLPYQGYSSISLAENAGNGHYNGLQVSLTSQIKKNLSVNVAYTYSSAIDPTTGGDLYTVSNPYNRAYDDGPSPYDRRNILVVNFIYDLPIFRSTQNHFTHTVLGGWEVAAIGTMQSGLPLLLGLSGDQSNNGVTGGTNRPDLTGNVSYPGTIASFFTGNFTDPALGAWGDMGKGTVRGPGRDNWNISLFKNFVISEAHNSRFELRVETFNSFNHTEFRGIGTTLGNSQFGQVTSTWDPRTFQLGAKLLF